MFARGGTQCVLLRRQLDVVDQRRKRTGDLAPGLFERDVRLQARKQVQPVILTVGLKEAGVTTTVAKTGHHVGGQGERHEQLRPNLERRADELGRRDADDRQGCAVDDEPFVQHTGIGVEPRAPEGVTQHRHAARRPIVVEGQQPADLRCDPENREVAA